MKIEGKSMRKTSREKNDDPIVDRIEKLLREQYKTQRGLTSYLGLPNGSYTRWRYGNGKSYMDHIGAIADFLGVSPNYLIRGNDGEVAVETLSQEESELIVNVRRLSSEKRSVVFNVVKWLSE